MYSWFCPNQYNMAADMVIGGICLYSRPAYFYCAATVGCINFVRELSSSHDTCPRCNSKPINFVAKTLNTIRSITGADQLLQCPTLSKIGLISSLVCSAAALAFKSQSAYLLVSIRTGMLLGRLSVIVMFALK